MKKFFNIIVLLVITSVSIYSSDQPHPRAAGVPADLLNKVRTTPEEGLKALVEYLTKGITEEYEKIRILHDWVAINTVYDTESYFSGSDSYYDPYEVAIHGKSVCEGYVNLLQELSELAGLKSEKIGGYARGYGYSASGKETINDNHAWNIFEVNGRKMITDVTWGSGYLMGKQFRVAYSLDYFDIRPEDFIYSHFPSESKWQLLSRPLNEDEFLALPNLGGKYFAFGLSAPTKLTENPDNEGVWSFSVNVPEDVQISTALFYKNKEVPDATLPMIYDGKCTVNIKFSESGDHTLLLYAKNTGEEQYISVATLRVSGDKAEAPGFPMAYAPFFENPIELLSPLVNPVTTGAEVLFRVRAKVFQGLTIINNGKFFEMQKEPGDIWSVKAVITAGEIFLGWKSGSNTYEYLCKWQAGN